jgi:hypothetical protein
LQKAWLGTSWNSAPSGHGVHWRSEVAVGAVSSSSPTWHALHVEQSVSVASLQGVDAHEPTAHVLQATHVLSLAFADLMVPLGQVRPQEVTERKYGSAQPVHCVASEPTQRKHEAWQAVHVPPLLNWRSGQLSRQKPFWRVLAPEQAEHCESRDPVHFAHDEWQLTQTGLLDTVHVPWRNCVERQSLAFVHVLHTRSEVRVGAAIWNAPPAHVVTGLHDVWPGKSW